MRFKEADGRKVVSAESAESIGRIDAYVIDTGARSVSAFRLEKVKGDATFVSWEDVQFGPDAVVVPSSDRLRTARDETEARLASKDLQPIGKLVLDEAGTALGKVGDVDERRAGAPTVHRHRSCRQRKHPPDGAVAAGRRSRTRMPCGPRSRGDGPAGRRPAVRR